MAPAATFSEAGTLAAELLLDREIVSPPSGAAGLIVTAPPALPPPNRVVGESVIPVRAGGLIVRVAEAVVAKAVAVIVAVEGVATT